MITREKKMMYMLVVIALAGLSLILYSSYKKKYTKLSKELKTLTQEVAVQENLLTQSADWQHAYDWFQTNSPEMKNVQDAQNELLNQSLAASQQAKLLLSPSKPANYLPAIEEGEYPQVKISIGFSATEPALFQWLTKMNAPEKFRAVSRLRIEPHITDKSMVNVEAIVSQWIAKENEINMEEGNPESSPSPVAGSSRKASPSLVPSQS